MNNVSNQSSKAEKFRKKASRAGMAKAAVEMALFESGTPPEYFVFEWLGKNMPDCNRIDQLNQLAATVQYLAGSKRQPFRIAKHPGGLALDVSPDGEELLDRLFELRDLMWSESPRFF